MNAALQTQVQVPTRPSFKPVQTGLLQRKCACGGSPGIAGDCGECSMNRLSIRRATGNGELGTRNSGGLPPIVEDVLRSPGQSLDTETRAFMEPRFGHDFSRVRVRSDAQAAESARAVNALAFTVGPDIVFGSGQYETTTAAGKKLLAHELAHIVQQRDQVHSAQSKLVVGEPGDQFEQEADEIADTITREDSSVQQQTDGIDGPHAVTAEEEDIAQSTRKGFRGNAIAHRLQRKQDLRVSPAGIIRRTASFVAGPVHAINNEASVVANGTPSGITMPLLNSAQSLVPANAVAAINRPATTGRSTATGGVECWLASVANNVGSFDETVLSSGPWTTPSTKANLGVRLGLPACTGAGNATLTANGIPTDADVAAANRTHENHHATDHETSFNSTISPWDTALTMALNSHQVFSGADPTACDAALFAAMGGTPDVVATNYATGCSTRGAAFHTTPAGGPLHASNPTSDATCTAAAVEIRS